MKFVYAFVKDDKKNVTVKCECKKEKVILGDYKCTKDRWRIN